MSEFNIMDDLGTALDPPGPPPDRLRHRVLARMQEEARPPRSAHRRWVWRLAIAGGMAAAVTTGAIAVQVIEFDGEPPTAVADASVVLTGAAARARGQAAPLLSPDAFVYTESLIATDARGENSTGPDGTVSEHRETWLSLDGSHDGLIRSGARSGGPVREVPLPGCRDGKETTAKDGTTVQQDCVPLPAYHDDLPGSPSAMLDHLYRAGAGNKNPRDQQAFTAGLDLLREAYLTPAQLAAVFEALARIPSVVLVRDVTDEAGRAGVAVTLTEVQQSRQELIVDPTTYRVLGERSVSLTDGRVLFSSAVLKSAIVGRVGATA
jgi:hypothetical protein